MEKTLITPAINMPIFKPKEEIVELISLLMPWAQPLRSHQIITPEIGVILHTEGIVQLSSIEDDYIIWQVPAPNVFCLSEVITGLKIATYRRFKSKLWFVPRENVLQALNDKPEHWAAVSTILAFQLSVALYRDRLMSERKTSEIVWLYLIQINNFPETERCKINVCSYICERTKVSKSAVMEELKKFRDRDLISIKKGILIAIDLEGQHK
ncbi:helix-turn-helix domain-containing protein [Citrobacter telavivensis]